jgi:N-acyl homoserine lactone hydrolase
VALAPYDIVKLNLGRIWLEDLGREIPVHGFLIRHPQGAGLVDTGYGTPHELIKDYRPVNASVADALRQHGVEPADVRWVINSHLHFDHCGQNAVFPQAPFYIQRVEFERRQRYETPKQWLEFAGARFELLDGNAEVVPGVKVVTTPGHTAGHQAIQIDTTSGPALISGDACWTLEMFGGQQRPEPTQMEDLATGEKSLDKLRRLQPVAVHFCHDGRTWTHRQGNG